MIRARLGALAVLAGLGLALPALFAASVGAQVEGQRRALMVFVPDVSFEELMAIPDVASLARGGGAALIAQTEPLVDLLHNGVGVGEVRTVADADGLDLEGLVPRAAAGNLFDQPDEVLVIVLGADLRDPSAAAEGGIVMAAGGLGELFPEAGEQGSLTSDSTRRDGIVVGDDVRATIEAYHGAQGPAAEDVEAGEPIEIVDGPPPFQLYDRYLAQRRMYVPIGTAAALYVTGAGLVAIALLARRRHVPLTWRRVVGWMSLSVPMLAAGLLATGHLPELSYATAVPMVAIVTVFGTMAFSPLERADLTLVPAGIGVAILVAFALEAASGWTGMLTPLLGGSQLDGGRFYGLPNVAIGLLVGACLWVAQRLTTLAGFALLCAAGLFAGLPFLGVNLGGAVTCFAAAGLWLAVRERARLGVAKGAAAALAVTAVGAAVILVSHAVWPVSTHVTRFEKGVDGLGGVFERFIDRLQVGFDLIARSPAALVPVVGLPIALFVVLRPPAAIRATFERWPAWRDAILVTLLAGIVAYVANDSGPAAAGLAFGLGLGGMIGVSLLASASKMEAE